MESHIDATKAGFSSTNHTVIVELEGLETPRLVEATHSFCGSILIVGASSRATAQRSRLTECFLLARQLSRVTGPWVVAHGLGHRAEHRPEEPDQALARNQASLPEEMGRAGAARPATKSAMA